jgi:hypothetical protein
MSEGRSASSLGLTMDKLLDLAGYLRRERREVRSVKAMQLLDTATERIVQAAKDLQDADRAEDEL